MKTKNFLLIKSKERLSKVKNKRSKKNNFERLIKLLKFHFEHIEKNIQTRRNEKNKNEKIVKKVEIKEIEMKKIKMKEIKMEKMN